MIMGELLTLPLFLTFAILVLLNNSCSDNSELCDFIAWQPYDSLNLGTCKSISLSQKFLICQKPSDSFILYGILSLTKQATISMNQGLTGLVTHISLSPDNSKFLVLSNFKRLYLTNIKGNLLCDFSPWMSKQDLELLASYRNPIVWVNDTTFISHFYSSCYECVDSNFLIGVFRFNSQSCTVSINNYIVPKSKATDVPWKLYALHPTPAYLVQGDRLLITFPFLPYMFVYDVSIGNLVDSLHINSYFLEAPISFKMKAFKDISEYRRHLHTYRLSNSWIGQPIAFNNSFIGTVILPKVPNDLIPIGIRPLSLWLNLNSKTYDVVFNTHDPITRILGVYNDILVASTHTGKVYLFKLTSDYYKCIDSNNTKKLLYENLLHLKQKTQNKMYRFLLRQVQTLNQGEGYLIWLPSGCQSDLLVISEQLSTLNTKFLLNDPTLAKLLPPDATTEIVPSEIKNMFNYQFPTITAFKIQDYTIQDTLTGFKILENLPKMTNTN